MDDDVISRLVEDAIDSESREVLTLSRSRSVTRACDSIEQDYKTPMGALHRLPAPLFENCLLIH